MRGPGVHRFPVSTLFAALLAVAVAAAAPLAAQSTTLTLPAAASIQGIAPFFSDVRAFNTSYTDSLDVVATYRCFIGPCPAAPPQIVFSLAPREAQAFDDVVAGVFATPNTAGGIELTFNGAAEQLVVTSRLYSTFPVPTVGMFIPGLDQSQAYSDSVLTSVRNGGPGQGFRTNVGFFNPGIASVTAVFTIFVGGVQQGAAVSRAVGPHSGAQINAIFAAAGVADVTTTNAVLTVQATGPVFSYAAVIDNETTDPYLVIGALDRSATPTQTPTGGTATPTATATATPTPTFTPTVTGTPPTATPTSTATFTPTATSTPSPTPIVVTPTFTASITPTQINTRTPTPNPNHIVLVGTDSTGHNTGMNFWDTLAGGLTSTIQVGQTVEWDWVAGTGFHSTTSGACIPAPCTPDFTWDSGVRADPSSYTHTFNTAGTFDYYCQVHGSAMQGVINVVAPP